MMRAFPLVLLLTACTQFPQVDGANASVGPAPSLLPMDELIAQTDQSPSAGLRDADVAALQARAEALRNQ